MPRLRLLSLLVFLFLAACESTPGRVFTYGSQGVEIQAVRLVADVYGHTADPLPYGGSNIDGPHARMKARWGDLRPQLEQGRVGLTMDGEVAVRDPSGLERDAARRLRSLVKAENRDRDQLYRAMADAVGYGAEVQDLFLPYVEETFGEEWFRQAPAGWWLRDDDGRWFAKGAARMPPAAKP